MGGEEIYIYIYIYAVGTTTTTSMKKGRCRDGTEEKS